jgi:hypothetical protein
MEELYPRQPRTDIPEVILREIGSSRIVYLPWDLDRVFWEILHGDHLTLLANAVAWVTRDEAPVSVSGEGMLDVTVWRQRASMTVHMVNLTNPMMMRGEFREFLRVGEQTVSVRIPAGCRVQGVTLLRNGQPVDSTLEDGRLVVLVPEIIDFEVIAIDLD